MKILLSVVMLLALAGSYTPVNAQVVVAVGHPHHRHHYHHHYHHPRR